MKKNINLLKGTKAVDRVRWGLCRWQILSNVWQLGEGGTCSKLKFSTNVRATFAKLLVVRCNFLPIILF